MLRKKQMHIVRRTDPLMIKCWKSKTAMKQEFRRVQRQVYATYCIKLGTNMYVSSDDDLALEHFASRVLQKLHNLFEKNTVPLVN